LQTKYLQDQQILGLGKVLLLFVSWLSIMKNAETGQLFANTRYMLRLEKDANLRLEEYSLSWAIPKLVIYFQ